MYRILKLVLLVVAANCAPSGLVPLATPLTQHYFYFAPQPQAQFQYQPLLKFQQPASPSAINRIDTPKEQYVLLYPTVPQIPLMALRQGESSPDAWTQLANWWNGLAGSWGQNPAPVGEQPAGGESGGGSTDTKLENIMTEKSADTIEPLPIMPASTMPLNMDKRLLLISGQPQFFGNFAAFHPSAINPVLSIQSLQRARSTVDSIPAENEQVKQPEGAFELSQQPAIVQPGASIQLRSSIVEPLQRLEIAQQEIPLVNNEPVPEVAAQQLARFLEEARSQDAASNTENTLSEKENDKLRSEKEPSEEDASIAQAKPSGIAVSGKGGLSSSAPSATGITTVTGITTKTDTTGIAAITGSNGIALASPSAIALSGDFEEDQERKMSSME